MHIQIYGDVTVDACHGTILVDVHAPIGLYG